MMSAFPLATVVGVSPDRKSLQSVLLSAGDAGQIDDNLEDACLLPACEAEISLGTAGDATFFCSTIRRRLAFAVCIALFGNLADWDLAGPILAEISEIKEPLDATLEESKRVANITVLRKGTRPTLADVRAVTAATGSGDGNNLNIGLVGALATLLHPVTLQQHARRRMMGGGGAAAVEWGNSDPRVAIDFVLASSVCKDPLKIWETLIERAATFRPQCELAITCLASVLRDARGSSDVSDLLFSRASAMIAASVATYLTDAKLKGGRDVEEEEAADSDDGGVAWCRHHGFAQTYLARQFKCVVKAALMRAKLCTAAQPCTGIMTEAICDSMTFPAMLVARAKALSSRVALTTFDISFDH